ncbi:hypothetical protein DERP_012976 [Dermatophagoides pteronyssinus]|uniref:Uncharacterized protein n=1 Tax=Dermatophagoides pteronyssinus TaxID=6956 RepID=A0ABQ8IT78_DERPT|nr:hypothetical protein DERP_012976 [Dermatophagoides pteronyssinus]
MGNILSSFFSRKQHENSKKSNVSANNIHNCQRNENDEKLCRSSTKKSKKSNIDPNKVLHNTYDQQNYCEPNQNDSVLKSKNGESESDNQKDHSPFQRDFYQPPHEILVPLEKYRPRRSNIRRSARINPIKSNHLEEFNVDIAPKLYVEETISKPPKSDYKPETSYVDNQNDEKVENDKEDENIVDDLDPSERTKVVRSKISELLRRQQQQQQQQQHQSALLLNNQRKYKSVFEPGLDYYKSSTNDIQLDLPEKIVDDETSPTNEETPNDVLRRPKKTMMAIHGNALLIDELKKRQSHFHESREPHNHLHHHHHQINSMASVQ